MTPQPDPLLQRAREVLEREASQLDDRIAERLGSARRRAVAAADRRPHPWRWSVPAGALAAAMLALALVGPLDGLRHDVPRHVLEDMELLASGHAPEFYADYEFYLWLEDQTRAG